MGVKLVVYCSKMTLGSILVLTVVRVRILLGVIYFQSYVKAIGDAMKLYSPLLIFLCDNPALLSVYLSLTYLHTC